MKRQENRLFKRVLGLRFLGGMGSVLLLAVLLLPLAVYAQQDALSQGADLTEGASFVDDNPYGKVLPPEMDPQVRLNPEAPAPFLAMARAYQLGDREMAEKYARQFVRYLNNVIFQVKDLTQIIGQAMIQEGIIDEEDWVGAEQYLDRELSSARATSGSMAKATHEEALRRITPDPKGEVEVYYFFSLSCSWCRQMGPDIERLWLVNKKDRKVKFVSLSTAAMPTEWATAYKQYTGMTMPMFEGTAIAKRLNVGFVPAVVVVTPNNKKAYLKTGQQSFQRLYEFVRTAQGAPIALSPEAEHVQAQTIGYEERRANPRGKAPGPELQRIGTEGSQARPVTASKNELGKF